jgi:hypothetical protein
VQGGVGIVATHADSDITVTVSPKNRTMQRAR